MLSPCTIEGAPLGGLVTSPTDEDGYGYGFMEGVEISMIDGTLNGDKVDRLVGLEVGLQVEDCTRVGIRVLLLFQAKVGADVELPYISVTKCTAPHAFDVPGYTEADEPIAMSLNVSPFTSPTLAIT